MTAKGSDQVLIHPIRSTLTFGEVNQSWQSMGLKKELSTLSYDDLALAETRIETTKARISMGDTPIVPVAGVPDFIGILDLLTEVIVFTRREFFERGHLKFPFWANIPKWIKVIVFFVRTVKKLIAIIKG